MMLEADVSMGVVAPADDVGVLGEIPAPEGEEPPPLPTKLTLRPQKGHIYIDEVLEGQVFTDSALLQRKILPEPPCGGAWQLVYDDDGYAGLISEDGDTLLQADTFLGMAIYKVADGMLHCVDCTKVPTEVWNYTDRLQEYTARTGELRIMDKGGVDTVFQLPVYQVRWPRGCGGRLLWAFNDELYKFLKLTCYKGKASKWFYVIFRMLRLCRPHDPKGPKDRTPGPQGRDPNDPEDPKDIPRTGPQDPKDRPQDPQGQDPKTPKEDPRPLKYRTPGPPP
jgi:hypothetical protein